MFSLQDYFNNKKKNLTQNRNVLLTKLGVRISTKFFISLKKNFIIIIFFK